MSSYFAKLNLAAVASLACLFTSGTLFAQDVTIKVENGTAKTITVSPAEDKKDDDKKDDDKKEEDKKDDDKSQPFTGKRAAVDVAILLDTSNSMNGLIGQAQGQLWNIVQEFSKAEKAGQTPSLRVAVFEYGNSGLPAKEGYIRQVEQLTTDMDRISEVLFELTTNGGDEYCGQVIDECLDRLDWSTEPNSYKAIFIAGNEPFTQGSVGYEKVCKKAIEAGVVVNTIHCGDYSAGVSGKWQHAAELAEGEYLNINQDKRVVQIKCPQDKIIIELNQKLNKTYLWFGAESSRKRFYSNQMEQDDNADLAASGQFGGGGLAQRAAAKASSSYSNMGRDLVDSYGDDAEGLSKLADKVLPDEMQKMDKAERVAHLEKMVKERAKIKAEIAKVNAERQAYIAAERNKLAGGKAEKTLGDVMTGSVRAQLKKSGFKMKK